jgi:hypothetical protein
MGRVFRPNHNTMWSNRARWHETQGRFGEERHDADTYRQAIVIQM